MEFSRQEYWSGLSFPSSENLLNPGIQPTSLVPRALAGGFFTTEQPGVVRKAYKNISDAGIFYVPAFFFCFTQYKSMYTSYQPYEISILTILISQVCH